MTYRFECPLCGNIREFVKSMKDASEFRPICTKCNIYMTRIFDTPVIKFIGKGFHCNDYKKDKK